jgi:hypothetical protein
MSELSLKYVSTGLIICELSVLFASCETSNMVKDIGWNCGKN